MEPGYGSFSSVNACVIPTHWLCGLTSMRLYGGIWNSATGAVTGTAAANSVPGCMCHLRPLCNWQSVRWGAKAKAKAAGRQKQPLELESGKWRCPICSELVFLFSIANTHCAFQFNVADWWPKGGVAAFVAKWPTCHMAPCHSCTPAIPLPFPRCFDWMPHIVWFPEWQLKQAGAVTLEQDFSHSDQRKYRKTLRENSLNFVSIYSCRELYLIYLNSNWLYR